MNYEQDFVNLLIVAGTFFVSLGVLCLFRRVDEEIQHCSMKRLLLNWFRYSILVCIGIWVNIHDCQRSEAVSLLGLGIYLVVCTVTDILICQVYDLMQYIGLLGGCIWVFVRNPRSGIGFSLILFAIIQYFILIRMYGKADGMGYGICSLYLAGIGLDVEGYLYHMGISFLMLAMIQGVKGNITKKGNLKLAVPLYPYLTFGFLVMWIFFF